MDSTALAHNFSQYGDGYRVEFPSAQIILDLTRWREGRSGPSCELTVRCTASSYPEFLITRARWNLTSLPSRRDLARMAQARYDKVDWPSVLELVARLALDHHEAGDPVVMIGIDDVTERTTYALEPLVLADQINTLFGRPGALKGWMALAAALDIQEGYGLLGLPAPPPLRPALYLDFEYDGPTQARRIQALCAGASKPRVNIAYRRCAGHLADQIEPIARMVADLGAGFGVVDSVEAATSSQGDGDPAGPFKRFTQGLRSIPITWLLVDHDSKGAERGKETPYGSRFKQAWSRNTWLIRKSQERPAEASIGLWHDATSNTGPRPPLGYRVSFDGPAEAPTRVVFHREDVRDVAGFDDLLTDWQKIERLLKIEPRGSAQVRGDHSRTTERQEVPHRPPARRPLRAPDGPNPMTPPFSPYTGRTAHTPLREGVCVRCERQERTDRTGVYVQCALVMRREGAGSLEGKSAAIRRLTGSAALPRSRQNKCKCPS